MHTFVTRAARSRPWVFISYARSDGGTVAGELWQRLEQEGIPIWQDLVSIEGGRDWWAQIGEALDQVTYMILVITPNAMRSETVRKEWRLARQKGVCVYPVIPSPNVDLSGLPRWMRETHFYDLSNELQCQRLLNDLNTEPRVTRVPFMVEDLPADYVCRTQELEDLVALLRDPQRDEPIAITAALRGAGGYGKTTLAKALCHDERIQEVFDDGILWITLGERPGELTERVEDLIEILSGVRPGFTSLETAVARLTELLADKDVLLVIDDVWSLPDLRPFLNGGRRAARLVTTRNLDVIPEQAHKIKVSAMRREEALQLIVNGLPGGCERELKELAVRLGDWPLLLKLVNKALADRVSHSRQTLADAISWVNRALDRRGLMAFDARDAKAREQAVAKTIGVSLEQLSAEERTRYTELAIFPADANIPLATVTKYWARTGGLDDFQTEELVERLHRLSLLLECDLAVRQIRLHDVLRRYLVTEAGERTSQWHSELLDAHGLAGLQWAEMELGEPYLWDHLAFHLVEAKRGEDLVRAVTDFRQLARKAFVRKALSVESDLLTAEQLDPENNVLQLLRRTFVQSGHLLNRCRALRDLQMTLWSRIGHREELKVLGRSLVEQAGRPCLIPARHFPDLPPPGLIRTLTGHKGAVFACAFSPDGARIASASEDHTVKIWDTARGIELMSLEGHTDWITGCAFSSDNSFLVSASHDGCLRLWDVYTGRELLTLKGHTGPVFACQISADGTRIVSSGDDALVKLWSAKTGRELLSLAGHRASVTHAAISREGDFIVSASDDRTLKMWDASTGSCRRTLLGHRGAVYACAISPDRSFIVSGSEDETVRVWDTLSGAERMKLDGHKGPVFACAVAADSDSIVSAAGDWTLRVWDLKSGTRKLQLAGHKSKVFGCAFSPDGRKIVSAAAEHSLKLWDRGTEAAGEAVSDYEPVNSCTVSPDGTLLLSTSPGESIKVRDPKTGTERIALMGHFATVTSCAFSRDGRVFVSASADRTLQLWDTRNFVVRISVPSLQRNAFAQRLRPLRLRRLIFIGHSGCRAPLRAEPNGHAARVRLRRRHH